MDNLYLILHRVLLNSFHWFCGCSIYCLTTRFIQSVLPFVKVAFMNNTRPSTVNCKIRWLALHCGHGLLYVAYVMPLV